MVSVHAFRFRHKPQVLRIWFRLSIRINSDTTSNNSNNCNNTNNHNPNNNSNNMNCPVTQNEIIAFVTGMTVALLAASVALWIVAALLRRGSAEQQKKIADPPDRGDGVTGTGCDYVTLCSLDDHDCDDHHGIDEETGTTAPDDDSGRA